MSSYLDTLRHYDYTRLKKELTFYFFLSLIIVFIILLIFQVIKIEIVLDNPDSNLLFTILNSVVYGGFFVACGFFTLGLQNSTTRFYYGLLLFLILIIGLTFITVRFRFEIWLFFYKDFCLSTQDGLWFFLYNFYIFFTIYGISFALEREK